MDDSWWYIFAINVSERCAWAAGDDGTEWRKVREICRGGGCIWNGYIMRMITLTC